MNVLDTLDGRLSLPRVDRPDVSVLMVTHGALDWVRRSLRALVDHTPPRYELVVVDSASPDGTAEWLQQQTEGARVVVCDRNLGFGVGNNLAAAHARGEYLCLLNSDALVTAGWLEALLGTFDRSPRVGAVVPLYLHEDGSVQEAGCAVEPDGRVVAIGVGDDPDRPEYRFARAVQYGSAACFVLRRATFDRLGGFDAAYGPAYYEDVDLAFRLRESGPRVWLQPAARVVHGQGASSPTHADAIALREANRERFRSLWAARLAGRPLMVDLEREPHRLAAARDFEAPERVLVVADGQPPDGRAVALAEQIARARPDARVTLALLDEVRLPGGATGLLEAGIEVVAGEDWPAWLAARLFHTSLVTGSAACLARLDIPLGETQPQAARLTLDEASARLDEGRSVAR